MKFYRLSEIPYRGEEVVFKALTTGMVVWPILYWAIGITLLVLGIRGTEVHGLKIPPHVFFYGGSGVFGLLGWCAFGNFRARMKPTNWLMRCNSSGVLIKYRSYLNWRFPAEDVQVVEINYSEMADIRESKETLTSGGLGSNDRTVRHLTYLDIRLVSDETSELETRLAAEQKAEAPPRGPFKYQSKTLDYPVAVLPGGIVRVRWSESAGYAIRPSLAKAMAYLSQHVKVATAVTDNVDLTQTSHLSAKEGDAHILKLANSGDKIGAVKLARKIYDCSLDDAVAFVDKLQAKG